MILCLLGQKIGRLTYIFDIMEKKIKTNSIQLHRQSKGAHLAYDVIVFCHLRWDFVYQRPQHIISRLSESYNVLVVEEPIANEDGKLYQLVTINPNLTILKPQVDSIVEIHKILQQLHIKTIDFAWFYSPAFVDLLPYLKINTVIYDCMDELAQFKGASQKLRAQEKFLIEEADLVFTGGKSLYEAKSKLTSNAHCFPSSVDVPHFQKATNALSLPKDMADIKAPIVGYIGVIDERIDLELLQQTSNLLPNVSFVMLGPLAKIDPDDLPRASNIHYLGMKKYNELPSYLKAFDIAMMPFALNEATEFISPTKTLEYMAADKPIISTAITDVVRDYSEALNIVSTAEEFAKSITDILTADYSHDPAKYENILNKTSWNNTVHEMVGLIQKK